MRRAGLASEAGISIVAAVAALAIMMSLGAVGLREATVALRSADHQRHVKQALQAADAAIEAAVRDLNRADVLGRMDINPQNPQQVAKQMCVASTGTVAGDVDLTELPLTSPTDADGRRWCPEMAAWPVAGSNTASYRVSDLARVGTGTCNGQGSLSLDRMIVAVGRAGNVRRRVFARLRANIALLSGAAVQSVSTTAPLTLAGTSRVSGDAIANHDIRGSGTNVISGNAVPGAGNPPHTVTGAVVGGARTAACHRFVLPVVNQGQARTTNDNGTWTWGCVDPLTLLSVSCRPSTLLPPTGGLDWEPATRSLRLWGNARMTLTGATYSLCRLRLEGQSSLVIPPGTPVVRVFLDDPAQCPDTDGSPLPGGGQMTVDGTSRIVNCHPQTQPESLQLYALGSSARATTQTLAAGAQLTSTLRAALCGQNVPVVGDPMVIYAPRSAVQLAGGTAIAGQVVGNTVTLSDAAAVSPVSSLANIARLGGNPTLPLYRTQDYTECRSRDFAQLPPGAPAQDC